MPDLWRPLPFKEPVWRFVGVLSIDSGYYIAQFDGEDYWDSTDVTTLDVTPLFLAAAPSEPVETFIAQPLAEQPWFGDAELEDYQPEVDVTSALFPPAVVEPVETFAAQPHYGDQFETYVQIEIEDYLAPAEQNEWTAPPEVPTAELIAAQPFLEDYKAPEETEDYANESALDVTPQLFPPFVAEPIETFAAQPAYGEDFDTLVPDETEDYGFAEQLEFLAPPEIRVPEIAAATELREQAWFPDQETEDYAPDPLEVPALYPATAQEPVESFAAQPLAEQWFNEAPEIEDYLALPEQLEFLAPPEAIVPEIIAAQPAYGEDFDDAAETEDYQQDSTLDPISTLFPTAQEAIEVFAAQPHFGEWLWEAEQTEDYPSEVGVEWFLGRVPDAELAANAQVFEQPWFPGEELEDYGSAVPLGVEAFVQTPLDVGLVAAIGLPEHWHYEADTWVEELIDEAWLAVLAGPQVGPTGTPVCDPDAVLAEIEALADELVVDVTQCVGTFDDLVFTFDDLVLTFDGGYCWTIPGDPQAVWTSIEATASESSVSGDATMASVEGTAAEVC